MTHPIDPPQSLIDQWLADGCAKHPDDGGISSYIAKHAALWGADVELKACCEWLDQQTFCGHRDLIPALCASRRPKAFSAKQQAKQALSSIMSSQKGIYDGRPFKILEDIIDGLPDD